MGKKFYGSAPRCFLATVEFAQIEDLTLENASADDAAIFNNVPVRMFFAILVTFLAAQKHEKARALLGKAVH